MKSVCFVLRYDIDNGEEMESTFEKLVRNSYTFFYKPKPETGYVVQECIRNRGKTKAQNESVLKQFRETVPNGT